MSVISLEFIAEQVRRVLDEAQRMRREMQAMREDNKFIRGDHNFLRHDLTGALLRLDGIDAKFGMMVERQEATNATLDGVQVKLQVVAEQVDLMAQNVAQVLALLKGGAR